MSHVNPSSSHQPHDHSALSHRTNRTPARRANAESEDNMTEELKQAISALQCAKRGHCDHAMADEAIAALEALTQRPAAQAEREDFEAWLRTKPEARLWNTTDAMLAAYQAGRASLPAPQQATPDPIMALGESLSPEQLDELWGRYPEVRRFLTEKLSAKATPEPLTRFCPGCGSVGEVPDSFRDCCPDGAKARLIPASLAHHCRDLFILALGAAKESATPEPVGEVFGYFRALPFGWEQCGEHDDGAVALYDRPAPGVPEDVQRDAERLDWLTFNISGKALRDIGVMWGEHANARAAIDAAMLAAAQAKGGQ